MKPVYPIFTTTTTVGSGFAASEHSAIFFCNIHVHGGKVQIYYIYKHSTQMMSSSFQAYFLSCSVFSQTHLHYSWLHTRFTIKHTQAWKVYLKSLALNSKEYLRSIRPYPFKGMPAPSTLQRPSMLQRPCHQTGVANKLIFQSVIHQYYNKKIPVIFQNKNVF